MKQRIGQLIRSAAGNEFDLAKVRFDGEMAEIEERDGGILI